MSCQDALARFAMLWAYALRMDPAFPGDWKEDLEHDLAAARALNGLGPERG